MKNMLDVSILNNNLNDKVSYKEFFSAFGYDEDDTIFLRYFSDIKENDWAKNEDITKWNFDSIIPHAHDLNNNRNGVFFVVNGDSQLSNGVKTARAQFIDFDDFDFTEQINRLNNFTFEPSIIIKTRKSLHCYWLLDKYESDIKRFTPIQKQLIQYFGSDKRITENNRVMRLYGFNHCKEEPILVKLIKFDPDLRYKQEDISAALPAVQEEKPLYYSGSLSDSELSNLANIKQQKSFEWVRNWLNIHDITIKAVVSNGTDIIIGVDCPWKDLHSSDTGKKQSAIIIRADGVIQYRCQHSHCEDKKWPDFREFYEPGYMDKGKVESSDSVFVLPKKLSEVVEKKVDWLIDGYIPRSGITILAADGGAGKTSTECAITAAVTSGCRPFLLGNVPRAFEHTYTEPGNVLFLSGEDYAEFTLCKKIRSMGGDLDKVSIVDPSDGLIEKCKIGSDYLAKIVDVIKPDLVIIDPLQAFIERDVNMSMRNQMRQALQPINELASKYNFGVIIAVHSNKRDSVSGRNRVSDSSDIWDMARSVLMVGMANHEEETRYISHEKSNWSVLAQTVLFRIVENGCIEFNGYTDKRDVDFQREANQQRTQKRETPKTQEVKEFIVDLLKDGVMVARDLQKAILDSGFSNATFLRARKELQDEKIITQYRRAEGQGRGTTIFWKLNEQVVKLSRPSF